MVQTEVGWIFGSKGDYDGVLLISRIGGDFLNSEEAFLVSGCGRLHG